DMVETFVNFRPKELWPKRVLKFDDAFRQTGEVWKALEEQGFLKPPPSSEERRALVKDEQQARKVAEQDAERGRALNDAAQKALERFDETQRELALLRYTEFEGELEQILTRVAVEESIRGFRRAVPVEWPDAQAEQRDVERLARKFAPEFGRWLA